MLKHSSIKTCRILNIDREHSTLSESEFIQQNVINIHSNNYIVSDADEELLILVEFHTDIDLESIIFYAFPETKNEDNDDNSDNALDIDMSPPKLINIYKSNNINISFDDLNSIKPNKTITCRNKKLIKGQVTNLKTCKNAVKFGKTRYLVIYIKSNQNESEVTYVNGIILVKNAHNNDLYENCGGNIKKCAALDRIARIFSFYQGKNMKKQTDNKNSKQKPNIHNQRTSLNIVDFMNNKMMD
eukprot:16220_1